MINITPNHLLTSNHVLVHSRGANQAKKHVQGVPNPEGVRSSQLLSFAAPPPQGRHASGSDKRGRDFYAGEHVRIRDLNGQYLFGQVAYAARSFDKTVFVLIGVDNIPVTNDPKIIVPTQ